MGREGSHDHRGSCEEGGGGVTYRFGPQEGQGLVNVAPVLEHSAASLPALPTKGGDRGSGQVGGGVKPSAVAHTCVNSPGAGRSSPPAGPAAWSRRGGPGTGPGSWRGASSASRVTAAPQKQHSRAALALPAAARA